jgi:hypothetical protein
MKISKYILLAAAFGLLGMTGCGGSDGAGGAKVTSQTPAEKPTLETPPQPLPPPP